MKTVKHNNIEIAYNQIGTGETTLLFVHGSFINQEYWQAQINYFSENYQVVTIDLAGHGKSGKNRNTWTIQEFAADVITVINKLKLRNVILIGHSMGAAIILEVAAAYPEPIKGFVAVDYFKVVGVEFPRELIEQTLDNLKKDFSNTSEAYARKVLLTPATASSIKNRVVKDYRTIEPEIGIPTIGAVFDNSEQEKKLLQQLKFKLYLINVDYFPTNEESLKKYVAAGELVILQGTCHFPMIESPEKFNELLHEVIIKIQKG